MLRSACLAGAVLAVAAAPSADAYVFGGRPWPRESISYYPGTAARARAIDRGARAWNRARVGIRFVRRSAAAADVVFRSGGRGCGGSAPLGYIGWSRSVVFLGDGCSPGLRTLNAAHEL